MKTRLPLVFILPCFAFATAMLPQAKAAAANIIPQPSAIKLGEGVMPLQKKLTIKYTDKSLKDAADILVADILSTHTIEAKAELSKKVQAGDIVLDLSKMDAGTAYRLSVTDKVLLQAATVDGVIEAGASLIQAIDSSDINKIVVQKMKVQDAAFRPFRGLMVDVKNQWHSIDDLKEMIDMCRFYKVNYFSLHTGEEQWIAALCDQTDKIPAAERAKLRFYTKSEMDELIAYGKSCGVYMFPHNESSPHFQGMKHALEKDYVQGDDYKGFVDELIGGGAYTGDFNDERFWNFLRVATEKGIEQFAAAYSDGVLPYYHVGPVQGEGGMGSDKAAKVVKYILDKSPKTLMMCWNGIAGNDANLSPYKKNIAIAFYQQWGGATVNEYMKAGWNVVNSAYSPLYIVGTRSRTQEQVYNDWNMFRSGHDGFLNGAFPYDNINWFDFTNDGKQSQVLGGMLTTWEVKNEDHMPQLMLRLPAFAENAWQYKKWPYDEGRYGNFKARFEVQDKNLKRFLSPPVAPDKVVNASGTNKVFEDRVSLIWATEGNNAIGFNIYRGDSDSASSAKKIATTEELQYIDKDVKVGQNYYYWIESYNYFGESEKVGPIVTSAGNENKPAKAYDSFDYANVDAMSKEGSSKSSYGWATPWKVTSIKDDSKLSIVEGLTYGNLPVAGKAMRIEHNTSESTIGTLIERQLEDKVGIAGTSTWVSFILKAEKCGSGHLSLHVGSSEGLIGKPWGGSIAGMPVKDGETYFVVNQIVNTEAGDVVYSWLNPALGAQPSPEDSSRTTRGIDIASNKSALSQVVFNNQTYGLGCYVFDELRIGYSWSDVTGGKDLQAPTPNHMTWEVPPIPVEGSSTSVQMTSVIADDENGVEYYFKECSGNPGGSDSGWIDKNFYVDKGLKPGYTYQYKVIARDKSDQKNKNSFSDIRDVKLDKASSKRGQ